MKTKFVVLGLLALALANTAFAAEGSAPRGIKRLDHVFLIMMENHSYSQIINNPDAPFVNAYVKSTNTAKNYFAVAHPSLTNYLEIAGGSNFGVQTDNSPDWHDLNCTTNLASGNVATDNPPSPNICPIQGAGTDAATPVIDFTNETQGPPGDINIDGILSFPAVNNTSGKTIADQLVAAGKSWKTYQESLPPSGADGVNFADGFFTDSSDIPSIIPGETQSLIKLYAAKHNPFVYFSSVQEGQDPHNSLHNVVAFDGVRGLYADLATGRMPNFSFIVPNQCTDQHGRGNGGPQCDFDPNDNGTQNGLNPALILIGDNMVERLVTAIKASPAWQRGRNAIIVVWDENDYSQAPNVNQVLLTVDTNYGRHNVHSNRFYTHFSLLKSLEAGFGLPCLNHACDDIADVMTDLFSEGDGDHDQDDHIVVGTTHF